MSAKIYIWIGKDNNVGHSSLSLSDGTYISWWPKEEKSVTLNQRWGSVEAQPSRSYEEDEEAEGYPADYTYEIPSGKLAVSAMNKWLSEFKTNSKYHLVFKNCCSVIYEALKKGGATSYASFPSDIISTPENLKEYAEKLKKATN